VSWPAYDPEGGPIGPRTNLKTWIDSICLATEPMNIRAGRGGARHGASKQASKQAGLIALPTATAIGSKYWCLPAHAKLASICGCTVRKTYWDAPA
jgi:hypothetical protein